MKIHEEYLGKRSQIESNENWIAFILRMEKRVLEVCCIISSVDSDHCPAIRYRLRLETFLDQNIFQGLSVEIGS